MRTTCNVDVSTIGSWQEAFISTRTPRVQQARDRVIKAPEVCLERARAEMEVLEEYKEKPISRRMLRAKIYERYLATKTIWILPGELIVGNINSKIRGSTIDPMLYNVLLEQELNDPKIGFDVRDVDRHDITAEQKKELNEVILPYFHGKTMEEYMYSVAPEDIREKSFASHASCPHIPNMGDQMVRQDAGHMLANYEKVLQIGLEGIRQQVLDARAKTAAGYIHFDKVRKLEFYDSALMSLDAAIAYVERYVRLAREMAEKESDPTRKAELLKIAEVCSQVPAKPARNWWEAVQSYWMTQVLILCEQRNYGESFGRFDQYMYPYYKKSVLEDKELTREEALELLELSFIKMSENTELYDYNNSVLQPGMNQTWNMQVGGQTREGTDACNEVTLLALEADEQVALLSPEISFRVWEGTPTEYLAYACEIVRLGRGKPKFYGDRTAIAIMQQEYPDLTIEDCRDYAVIGCVEIALPNITQQHSFTGLQNLVKILDLTIHNGKCSVCGKQIGPETGDVHDFKTFADFQEAFRRQTFYWMEHLVRGVKFQMDIQSQWTYSPFGSCLLEGPIETGRDMIEGGCWYTGFGVLVSGAANVGDSLGVIDTLIYREKKIGWDDLTAALQDNWKGHEQLQQMAINGVPKYGNDDDYADGMVAFALNTWCDAIDYFNNQKDMLPAYGGRLKGCILIGNGAVAMGSQAGATPDGREFPHPLADTLSPVQGRDTSGATAVIKSLGKLPHTRFGMGTAFNQRFTKELLQTDEDVLRFAEYMKTAEQLGMYHAQFNVINCETLRDAMAHPDQYRDLLVRVASFVAYFTELDPISQMDLINRTENAHW